MRKRLEVYKCEKCGNIIEVLHGGGGKLICCGDEMNLLAENSQDAATEKHVPIIEKTEQGYKVTVGSVEHPMMDNHWIQWVELIADGEVHRRFLNPGDKPEALFCVTAEKVTAREYCNLHGHWKGEA